MKLTNDIYDSEMVRAFLLHAQHPSEMCHDMLQMSPLIDRTILKTVKQAFGGRVRFVVSGGAPLGPSVEEFLNITLCCPVLQVCQTNSYRACMQ